MYIVAEGILEGEMLSEQGFLRTSIVATVAVAAFGIVFGLLSGSFSIAFDGAYSLADAGMTILALWVSSLIVRSAEADALSGRLRNRFTMGFWHLEPIVLGLNGTLLMAVAIYALINAVITIVYGGNELRFGVAIVYAAVTLVVCMTMAVIGVRANRRLRSDFVALDVKAWMMSAGITSALLIAFLHRPGGSRNAARLDFSICGPGRPGAGLPCDHPYAGRCGAAGAVRDPAHHPCRSQGARRPGCH